MSYLDTDEFNQINAALSRVEGAAKLRLDEDSKPSNRGPESAIWRRDSPELPSKEAEDEMPSNGDEAPEKVEWADEDEDEDNPPVSADGPESEKHPVAKNIGRAAGGALGAEFGPPGIAAGQYLGGKVAPHLVNAFQNSPAGALFSKIKEKFGDHPVAHAVGKMAGSMLDKHMAKAAPPEEDDEDAQPGMPNYDEQEESVKEPKVKDRIRANGKFEWRGPYEKMIAEMNVISGHVAKSGLVPTPGVHHDNKLAAGNKGLQGEPVQPVEPKKMDQEAGENEYDTLDDNLPEGCEKHFEEFLSERGLSVELFTRLIDEATESENIDEMEQLIAVQRLFENWLKKHFPTVFGGHDDREERTKKSFKQGIAMMKANPAAVKKANAHGMAVPKNLSKPGVVSLKMKKRAMEHRERLSFEADDDGGGSPSVDWEHLIKKYGKKSLPKQHKGQDEVYGDETRPMGTAGVQGGGIV